MTNEEKAFILNNLKMVLMQPDGLSNLAKYVAKGDITIEILKSTGQFSQDHEAKLTALIEQAKAAIAQEEIRQQEEKARQEEDNMWAQCVAANSVPMYENYLIKYPNGRYVQIARTSIENWRDPLEKQKILEKLKRNINAFAPSYLEIKGISLQDILDSGITVPERIEKIYDKPGVSLDQGKTPDSIAAGRTEIYFWGAPGSGKTCTLAAILRTAEQLGVYNLQQCNGLKYMTQLKGIFLGGAGTLPPPTSLDVVQELAFDLFDEHNEKHPVTLIDIAGELFKKFSEEAFGNEVCNLPSYVSLKNLLLSTNNPKFHFFIVDVTNDSTDVDGLSQMDYLNFAMNFIDTNKVFNSKTAGIYILVTKSDLLSPEKSQRAARAMELLNQNYASFARSLKDKAIEHNIIRKDGNLPVIPFTLGEVYFKTKCLFDPETSQTVIKVFQENISKVQKPNRGGFLNW